MKGWSFTTTAAGRLTVWTEGITYMGVAIHVLPREHHRLWGYSKGWYDGPLYYFGLGPILLVSWGGLY